LVLLEKVSLRELIARRLTSREIIGRLLDASYTLVETSISTEVGAENAVLESRWILEIQVDLAVQAVIHNGDSWAD
jgi:hypothetical protein